jgi:hypothetical protein
MALLAAIAAFGTAALLLSPGRRNAVGRLAQQLIGGAALTWAVGHAMAARSLDHSTAFPSAGDLVAASAAPLAVAGVLVLVGRRTRKVDLARLGLDALLLGCAAALFCWRLFFRADGASADVKVVVCVVLITDFSIVAMLLLLWLRDLDTGLLVTFGGVVLYSVGDVVYMHVLLQPGQPWPWQAAALWGLAWPTIGLGLLSVHPPPVGSSRDTTDKQIQETEARTTAGVTAGCLLLMVGTIASVLSDNYAGPVTLHLALLVVLVLAAREVVGSLQRQSMLRRLTELAYSDALTGLANRRALTARLAADTGGTPVSVLTLDLDGFKEVNDMLGHSRGDQLLAAELRGISDRRG